MSPGSVIALLRISSIQSVFLSLKSAPTTSGFLVYLTRILVSAMIPDTRANSKHSIRSNMAIGSSFQHIFLTTGLLAQKSRTEKKKRIVSRAHVLKICSLAKRSNGGSVLGIARES